MTKCLICEEILFIDSLSCKSCNTTYKGKFYFSRLARLNLDEQKLVESLMQIGNYAMGGAVSFALLGFLFPKPMEKVLFVLTLFG